MIVVRKLEKEKMVSTDNITQLVDVEPETSDGPVLMDKPFNPAEIDITTKSLTVDLLIKRLEADPIEIDLTPEFQRGLNLWNKKQQSQLIESLLIKFPLPAFYFDGTNNNNWLVIDGLQRLCALNNFVVSKTLKLVGMEFLDKLEGKGFDDLSRNLQRDIEESQITAYIVNPGTPDDVKFNIFKRLNTGGLVLTPQEIRHALNQGTPAKFIEELASAQEFRDATGGINPERMLDREFVTRFFAFYISPVSEYKPDLDSYMNNRMQTIKNIPEDTLNEIKYNFIESMNLTKDIFGKHSFRKVFNKDDSRNRINKALFEVWSVTLAKLPDKDRDILRKRNYIVFDDFIILLKEDDFFIASISSSTDDKKKTEYRYQKINGLINGVLGK
jgi:hypothetical protein